MFLSLLVAAAFADVPQTINYTGYLSEGAAPVSGTLPMEFHIYDEAEGGGTRWKEVHPEVSVQLGTFEVDLGDVEPFKDVFATARWLEVVVDGQPLSPRMQLHSTPFALEAQSAGWADRLGGLTLEELMDTMDERIAEEVERRLAETSPTVAWTSIEGIPEDIADGVVSWEQIEGVPEGLEEGVGALSWDDLTDGDEIYRDGDELVFAGVNVRVVNGSGSDETNGLGNLLVGYGTSDLDGSHNVVLGEEHDITASHSLVLGEGNEAHGSHVIAGGVGNRVDGVHSLALGAQDSIVDADYGLALSGKDNLVEDYGGAAILGVGNTVRGGTPVFHGFGGAAIGGFENTLTSAQTVALSGIYNTVDGSHAISIANESSVVNGAFSTIVSSEDARSEQFSQHTAVMGSNASVAEGFYGVVVGGQENTASSGVVVGGALNQTLAESIAGAGANVVVGGRANEAFGSGAVVVGGWENSSSGVMSVSTGGHFNTSSGGDYDDETAGGSTLGGGYNQASGQASAVVGGGSSTATGGAYTGGSTVIGGYSNYATGVGGVAVAGFESSATAEFAVVVGGRGGVASGASSSTIGSFYSGALGQDTTILGTWFGNVYDGAAGSVLLGQRSTSVYVPDVVVGP